MSNDNDNNNDLRIDPEDREDIRIAVVLNGGVSLAVWIGGVVNEINRLVQSRSDESAQSRPSPSTAESAKVYGSLLDLVGATARADVIAGTSAGGINGAFLAYAQVYGLDLRQLGDLWADLGSFDAMLRESNQRNPESVLRGDEYFLRELAGAFDEFVPEYERRHRYVLPELRPIDLIINTTLMHGQPKRCTDDFSTEITESVHTGRFRFTRAEHTPPRLDPFREETITRRLALASRCTASFPVAFEPSFAPVGKSGKDEYHPDMGATAGLPAIATFPQSQYVIDGGVLLNQPVKPALAAIYAQPADRQVRRLLVHVNPDPRSPVPSEIDGLVGIGPDSADNPPNLAAVLKALATLPYAQSVDAELTEIRETNERVRQYRSERPNVIGTLNEELAAQLITEYRTVRSHREADRIYALLAEAADQPRMWWTRSEFATALREVGAYIPADLPDPDSDLAQWDWGVEPVEHIGAVAVDIFKRAMWLAGPNDTELRRRLRGYRRRLHAALAQLRQSLHHDEEFWRRWAAQPPLPPAAGSDASERQEQLRAWLQDALAHWPLPPDAQEAPAATLPNQLGAVAERIAHILIDACDDLRRVTVPPSEGQPAAMVANVTHETKLLDKLLQAVLPDSQQLSPASLLRRLLAVEVCQLAIAGVPLEVEQEVTLQQVSGFTPNSFGMPATPTKIAGIKLFWFGAFFKKSWRVNDWIWGRLDGATRMVQATLDPARLRQLGLSSEKTYDQLRRLAVGGKYEAELGTRFDADSGQILAELAFLDAPDLATTADHLMTTVLAVARRLHADILTEELPHLADAVRDDPQAADDESPGARFLNIWRATPDPSLDQLFTMFFTAAGIVDEPFADAVSAGLLRRSAAVTLRLAENLATQIIAEPILFWQPAHLVGAARREILGALGTSVGAMSSAGHWSIEQIFDRLRPVIRM
jgi:patatin-related protein